MSYTPLKRGRSPGTHRLGLLLVRTTRFVCPARSRPPAHQGRPGSALSRHSFELAKVILAAQTHSQASVSSPTVRFYRPGTELQIVRREGIWSEVSDPVTQERGWVLAQYLSSIDSPIPAQVATESSNDPLTVAPTSPKSNKRHRAAKHAVHGVVVAKADPGNARWARRADRRREFGLFMFRPLPIIRTAMRQHNFCN